MNKYITNREIYDEDWKTQSAKGYPNIPANEEVEIIKIYSNFYGKYVRIKWHGNIYDTYPNYIKKLDYSDEEFEDIIDKINLVGNINPLSAKELQKGINKCKMT